MLDKLAVGSIILGIIYFLVGEFPVIPHLLGWLIGGVKAIFYSLAYIGADCQVIDLGLGSIIFLVLVWLIFKLIDGINF